MDRSNDLDDDDDYDAVSGNVGRCIALYTAVVRALDEMEEKTSRGSVKGRGTTRETARRTSRLLCINYLLLYYILIVFFVSRCGRVKIKRMLAGRQLLCTTRRSKRARI